VLDITSLDSTPTKLAVFGGRRDRPTEHGSDHTCSIRFGRVAPDHRSHNTLLLAEFLGESLCTSVATKEWVYDMFVSISD
jgi:hypothetical protein